MIGTGARIRAVTADDIETIGALADATGLFPADMLPEMIADYIRGSGEQVWRLIELQDEVVSFAFAEPEKLTDRAWNLRAIGVDPARRRQGVATALLAGIEAALRARAARLVVIETTDAEDQLAARAFYPQRGYDETARIHDFWEAGVDKLVFCKSL